MQRGFAETQGVGAGPVLPPVRPCPTCTAGCRLVSLASRWGRWWKMLGSCRTFLLEVTFHSFSLVSSATHTGVEGQRSEVSRRSQEEQSFNIAVFYIGRCRLANREPCFQEAKRKTER